MRKHVFADLALGVSALIWGATFVVVKDALVDVSVLLYIVLRFGLAAIVIGALSKRSLQGLNRESIRAGAQIGFFMFGGYVVRTIGLKFTTPSKAAFITGSSVVLVPILLAGLGWRRVSGWVWTGAFSALVGLYLLTVPAEGIAGLNRGDPLVLGCAGMFARHIIFGGRHARYCSVGALSFLQITTTAGLALLALPLSAAAGWERPHIVLTSNLIYSLLITAMGATVIAFPLQVWAQQHTSAAHTAILLSLEPVFAAITSWLFGHEHFGRRIFFGASLILSGILLADLKGRAPAAPESPEPLLIP